MSWTGPTLTCAGTGDKMPVFGYGTWLSEKDKLKDAVKAALDAGYRHIDEAWIYGNEGEVGEALKESSVARSDIWITSKLWNNFHRPERVKEGCLESIKALGVEQLDLYLMHFPVSFKPDVTEAVSADQVEEVPLEDTWKAMEALVDEGLVRNIGVSNFEIEHVKRIQAVATKPIASNQFETQPYWQRRELVEYCTSHGIHVTAHTSLGSGANVMSKHHASPPLLADATIGAIAEAVGKSPAQVLLRWALQRPTIVIPRSMTPERIVSNLDIFGFELTAEQMASIDGLDKGFPAGCFNHPKTPWLGRSEFTGSTASYCNA